LGGGELFARSYQHQQRTTKNAFQPKTGEKNAGEGEIGWKVFRKIGALGEERAKEASNSLQKFKDEIGRPRGENSYTPAGRPTENGLDCTRKMRKGKKEREKDRL